MSYCRTNSFIYSLFPYTIREQNKLDVQLCSGASFKKFRNALLKFGWLTLEFMGFMLGLKFLYSWYCSLDFVLVCANLINKDSNPRLHICSIKVESIKHFSLHCHYYSAPQYFFLEWFKQYFTTICTSSRRHVC